jgi:surface protein
MFRGTSAFNQPLNNWNVSNVTVMNQMFSDASAFNQDLSMWCVSNIPNMSSEFDLNATNWTLPKPVWGTCPAP